MSIELVKQIKSFEKKIETQDAQIASYKSEVATLTKSLKTIEDSPAFNVAKSLHATPIDHKEEGQWGFKSFGHFAHEVRVASMKGGHDTFNRIEQQLTKSFNAAKEKAGLVTKTIQGNSETVDTEGNVLVPPTFAQTIFERVYNNDLLSRLDKYPVTGRSMVFPRNAETSRVDGSRAGGVLSYWADEGSSVTATKPKWSPLTMTLRKLMVFGAMTSEMLEDSPYMVGGYLEKKFAEEITFQTGAAVVRGTGVGQPLGILNQPAVVSVAKETGQAAASIVPQNIWKMYARMWAPSVANAVWLINQDVWPALFGLKYDIGTAGVPVFLPPTGISGAPYGTLLGRPVLPVEFCSTLGTVGDIIFTDLSQVIALTKGDAPNTQMSQHLYFDSDQMAYRTIFRVDINSWWPAALTPYKGSNTQAPVVTLATRS